MNGFKIGAFGSNAIRFNRGESKETPGPGAYNDANNSMNAKVSRTATAPTSFD